MAERKTISRLGGRFKYGATAIGLALSAATMLAAPAYAQDTGASDEDEIVVTGSLFRNRNVVAASPIVTTDMAEVEESGVITLESLLNQLPAFAPAGTAGTGGQGTGGRATVNLHGLGSNRNLVVLDGRRLPLADISGNVDINFIPGAILSGVETITGGASAVYGSDAMSGVVNFRTLNNFDGIRFDTQYGNSWQNDLQTTNTSLSLGTSFGEDRGNVLLSFSYTDREGLSGSERDFWRLVTPSSFIGQGTFTPAATNLPDQAAVNALFAGYGVATPVANTLNLGFNDNGSLFVQNGAQNYQGPTSNGYAVLGGNVRMPVGVQFVIQNPLDRRALFAKFDYELAPTLTLYGQAFYVDSTVTTSSGGSLTQFGTLTTIPVTNPFIPADLAGLLATRGDPNAPFTWNGRYIGLPAKAWDEQYTVQQTMLGVRGDLPLNGWSWDLFSSYDSTDHHQSNYHAVLKNRVQTLLNAPDGGDSICAGGFNPFGIVNSSNISAACEAYMTTTAQSTESLTQHIAQFDIQGPVFSLPAGDVNLALLVNYRRNTYRYDPDADLAAQNIEAVIASQPSRGNISVVDFAAQVDVPILRNAPFAHQLNLGAGFRYSDYNTSGGVEAYEADVKWWPVEDLLVRASYQRAVRAPNIGELFAAASGVQVAFGTPPAGIGDPCDIRSSARTGPNGADVRQLCLDQGIPLAVIDSYIFPTTATGGRQSGNPNLEPETADTFNVGFVWSPGDITLSVDYYSIEITDVISVVPGLTTLSKCYNLDGSNPTYSAANQFCSLLERDSAGLLEIINLPFLNLGGLRTSGIDIQAEWGADFADLGLSSVPGGIAITTGIGWIEEYAVQTLPGTAFVNFEGTNTIGASRPEFKALTTFAYNVGPATLGVRWRYQDSMDDVTSVTTPSAPQPGVDVYQLFDIFGSWEVSDTVRLRAGVNNVADEPSVRVSSSQTSTDTAVFDPVGRSYYVGLSVDLN